jgi:hypothetical protein
MKRSIGDFVTIKKDLKRGPQPITGHYATLGMESYRGQKLRIRFIHAEPSVRLGYYYAYKLCNNDSWWTEDMFEECCL